VTGEPSEEAARSLLDLLAGKYRSQAVSTAAALGLADRLAAGRRSAAELAAEIGCDAGRLERLLRLLSSLGLCDEEPAGFGLAPLGQALRGDALGPLAEFVGSPEQWDPWSRLREALASGAPTAYEIAHGTGLYEHLARDQAAARRFDAAIDAFTRHEARALCRLFDFSVARKVVDIGGGHGTLLRELLGHWPHLRGVLFDLPHVVEPSRAALAAGPGARIEVVGGRFQDSLPAGGDVYVLRHVLHNWDDDIARPLLARIADALGRDGRVLVIDGILSPDNRADTTRWLDLEMLVLTGGRERRKPELRRLFTEAGLAWVQAVPLAGASWLIVGARRQA
jgi:SAM-dependent methyltransferase